MTDPSTLLQHARQLDEQALGEIYDLYSPAIYRYASRLLGDADQAEECVADTFSRLLIALHNGGGPKDHLSAYLYRIAHNWITDSYRRKPIELPLDSEDYMDGLPGPSAELDQKNRVDLVRKALRKLTPEQRQVIVLRYLEDLSNAEIAESIEKPIGSVKALLHRGLDSLRRVLVSEREEDVEESR